ncbi:MAG: ParB N-terminal domain-containing protein [Blautia sp.]|nr:ParB N-terminal domain-containing protein [Blautia sp.]
MKVSVKEIKTREGRRSLDGNHVKELAESIRELGLINPLTIDRDNHLIAGLHRLEAVRLLGWTEVECTVSSLEGLQAELAEIDENFVRNDLSAIEYSEMLLRRKEIYESLHPETKHGGTGRARGSSVQNAHLKRQSLL